MTIGNGNVMKRLVLVGGGHAHIQVIKALNRASRPKHLHVTLIDMTSTPNYSGMIPGCISKLYKQEETQLQLRPLAEWASIEFIEDQVIDIDLDQKLVYLKHHHDTTRTTITTTTTTTTTTTNQHHHHHPIPFDVVSIDIGSTSRSLHDFVGANQYTIPTRPISKLVQRIAEAEATLGEHTRVVVVGGGLAGIELALSIHGRWHTLTNLRITLLDAACSNELLPKETPACRRKLYDVFASKGTDGTIDMQFDCGACQVEPHAVVLPCGRRIPFDYCIWATGAGAHELNWTLAHRRGLQVSDPHGWIQVNSHLQSLSHPFVFAAGDCCEILPHRPPKAGVYAVRAGPILIQNLTQAVLADEIETIEQSNDRPLVDYHPQSDFLKIIACGDGTALGFKFGIPIYGPWVWQLKDMIDKKFMDLFRPELLPELEEEGEPYDTSQYDAQYSQDASPRMEPAAAAAYLQREDDDVDFHEGWSIFRNMSVDETYRNQVLSFLSLDE